MRSSRARLDCLGGRELQYFGGVGVLNLATDGAAVVLAGQRLERGEIAPVEAVKVLDHASVFLEKPDTDHAALQTYSIKGDQWVLAFSSTSRLLAARGLCEYIALIGQDLMDNMPAGVNLGIDIQDRHSFFVPAGVIAARTLSRGGELA